jgi:hypothetical protein
MLSFSLLLAAQGPISPAYVADHFVTGQLAQSFGAMMVRMMTAAKGSTWLQRP